MGNRIYRYVVKHDLGYAPCADNSLLTLCICKPRIRKAAEINDWLIGFTSVAISRSLSVDINSVIYIAQVTEKVSMEEYFSDKKEPRKDKIYGVENGNLVHLGGEIHNTEDHHRRDKRGMYCLKSNKFKYYGQKPATLPPELEDLNMSDPMKRIGERSKTTSDQLMKLARYATTFMSKNDTKNTTFPDDVHHEGQRYANEQTKI